MTEGWRSNKSWTLFSSYGAYKQWYTLQDFANTDFQRPGCEITIELDWYELAFVPFFIAAAPYYIVAGFELGPLRIDLFVRWAGVD